ncbi:MAG: hypothetical protein KYX62_16710 [Pseudomonadota bacterium]|nr:hypothetical protein [Pseudomonadota bacterium]
MQYPHFIAIDGSSWEPHAHPVAIAWSMADGQIKTTLIQPEDDWDDWDITLQDVHGINPDTLYQLGETVWSVIRELENDLEQSYLFSDDAERSTDLLDKLYDACRRDLSLEIIHCSDAIDGELPDSSDMHYQPCDERVRLMLLAWAAANNGD